MTVRYDPRHVNCAANQLEVKTFVTTPDVSLSNEVAFTIIVP